MNPKILLFVFVLIGVSLACSLPVAPSSTPARTFDPTQSPAPLAQSNQTAEAQTQVAVLTEVAFFQPGTQLPAPTSAPTLAPTLAQPLAPAFSAEQANPVAPADVLEEVSFFQEGDGGVAACPATLGLCEMTAGTPGSAEWLDPIYLAISGGDADSDVKVSILDPDNRPLPDNGQHLWSFVSEGSVYAFSYSFPITSEMSIGDYRFTFNFPNGDVETSVNVFRPTFPSLRVPASENKLLLFNFAPGESVRLLMYQRLEGTNTLRFAGWSSFVMDDSGALTLERPVKDTDSTYYFAIGEQSGPVNANGLELQESLLKP